MTISRRSLLALPLLPSLRALAGVTPSDRHGFLYDHVLGTSLDLVVWTGSPELAGHAARIVLDEVARLSSILNTRDPESEISLLERAHMSSVSPELAEVLALYEFWERCTGGVMSLRPGGAGAPINVDALGKAYIIDRAVRMARLRAPGIDAVLLNVGGDIVAHGRSCEVLVADPALPYDNAPPIARLVLRNAAVATSGTSARGSHLVDGRTGHPPLLTSAATVVAMDAVTANALATTLCIADADEGLSMAERTRGAEALRVSPDGVEQRTSGFARLERAQVVRTALQSPNWPDGYRVTLSFALPNLGPRTLRPFLAVWAEDERGRFVKLITLWGLKAEWYKELPTFMALTKGDKDLLFPVTRPTRSPGRYQLLWDGRDNQGRPVPRGTYRIVIESSRERGAYARRVASIVCGSEPATATVESTANWENLTIGYGPKPSPA